MLPAANRGVGQNICAPDVCLTPPPPPKPIPYTNIGMHSMAVNFSPNIYICALNALHIQSIIPTTLGDQPGIFGPGPMRVGQFQVGNPIVMVNMIPGVNLTCPATGNAMNAAGASIVPDVVNVFYTLEGAPVDHTLSASQILELRSALEDAPAPRGELLDGGVAHLRLPVFTADVSTLVYNEIARLEAEGMRALILDLRGCPGGDLAGALRLAEDFLPAGTPLARIVDADGDEVLHRSRREYPYTMPLTLLVDRGTASAAELFAGCLQATGRASLAGEPTHGKASAQQVVTDPGGAPAHATVARWTLPDGTDIAGRGLLPDLEAPAAP